VNTTRSTAARLVLALALAPSPAWAEGGPTLELPVDCRPGLDCFVQNYPDHDPGPGAADYTCGPLSYDGHDGTDIRLPDLVAMRRGVEVLAAAPGVVLRVRDGMADASVREVGAEAIEGREAGNAVIVDHGDGWETQYSHLAMGSVAVAPGDRVEAGDVLGRIGLSGNTEYPHLELVVRRGGAAVDPFTGPDAPEACGGPRAPLWSEAAARALAYVPGGLLSSGFATEEPDPRRARDGGYAVRVATADQPALVFWVDVFGTRAGDVETIRLVGPDGRALAEARAVHDRTRAQWFRFLGKRRPEGGWPPGVYVGTYLLERTVDGAAATIAAVEGRIQVP
jgi:hypothetical protein